MHPYKIKFIETSYDSTDKKNEQYGKIDGLETALNVEAYLVEKLKQGFELVSIVPTIGNVANKMSYPNNVTIGYHLCLKKIKD